jgi:hypothetical protein
MKKSLKVSGYEDDKGFLIKMRLTAYECLNCIIVQQNHGKRSKKGKVKKDWQ